MVDRLISMSFALLASAAAVFVAVRLVESVAVELVFIAAGIGSLLIVGFAARVWWTARSRDRW